MEPVCPQCHVAVRATDFFCYNCGKNLKPRPLPTSTGTMLMYYLGSIVLPPMGIVWGMRYIREQDQRAKFHGYIFIGLTVIELILFTVWTVNFVHGVNSAVNQQLNGLQGF